MQDYEYTDQSENTEAKNRFFAILEKLADTKDFQDFGAILDRIPQGSLLHLRQRSPGSSSRLAHRE